MADTSNGSVSAPETPTLLSPSGPCWFAIPLPLRIITTRWQTVVNFLDSRANEGEDNWIYLTPNCQTANKQETVLSSTDHKKYVASQKGSALSCADALTTLAIKNISKLRSSCEKCAMFVLREKKCNPTCDLAVSCQNLASYVAKRAACALTTESLPWRCLVLHVMSAAAITTGRPWHTL